MMLVILLPIIVVSVGVVFLFWAMWRRERALSDLRVAIGGLVGCFAGLVYGAFVPLYFYLLMTTPKGTPWGHMDQAGLLMVLTGPLGAMTGAIVGGFACRHRLRPVVISIILASAFLVLLKGPAFFRQ